MVESLASSGFSLLISGFQNLGSLPSWSVQLDSPGTAALTVGGWIRPGGGGGEGNKTIGQRGDFDTTPSESHSTCSLEVLTGKYLVLTLP